MMWLRQSTISVINFGPVLDMGDGVTLEVAVGIITSLDHAATGIMLSKNGGTLTIREQGANFVATTYDAHGCYKVSLSAIDTGTLGRLRVIHTEPATYLAVWQDFMVVPAQVWDSMFGADKLDVAVAEQANIDFGALQKLSLNAATPAVTVSDKAGFSLAATGADLILKTSTFAVAIVAAINELATYGLTALNTLLVTTGIKAASVPALVQADVRTAVGLAAANLDTQLSTIDTVVDAIKVKTDTINDAGALVWTYTLTDSVTGATIPDATVIITSDSAGANVLRTGVTNSAGVATFYFAPGDSGTTVYIFCTKAGWNFAVDQEVIS